jgi:PIN domain nuclease of toxin-antitoxin system
MASAASVWEIAIKQARGRISVPSDFIDLVRRSGFDQLPIAFEHAEEAGRLPLHHHDPFDRMLIAQARLEGLTLATADADIRLYEVATLEVARA